MEQADVAVTVGGEGARIGADARDAMAAQQEMDAINTLKVSSPLISGLAAEIRIASNDVIGAQTIYREALQRFPQSKALIYGYAESLLSGR